MLRVSVDTAVQGPLAGRVRETECLLQERRGPGIHAAPSAASTISRSSNGCFSVPITW